jgi:flagellin
MATLAANGAYYRIQDHMTRNDEKLSNNMQRLSSGLKNVTAGSRAGDVAVTDTLRAGVSALSYAMNDAKTGVAALEMAVADLSRLSAIITRLYEMNHIAGGSFTTTDDKAMLGEEIKILDAEFDKIKGNIKYKNKDLAGAVNIKIGTTVFGSDQTVDIGVGAIASLTVGETEIEAGNGAVKLTADKLAVDKLRIDAASNYNRAAWAALHVTNQVAGAKMELSYYQDVDFAAETSELAKHQIIAQAGTAMLAQANSQGQGVLALLQD